MNTAEQFSDRKKIESKLALSGRLAAVAAMVTAGNRVCDVGCDHGFVPIWLVEQGICPGAIAMDVNRGPLKGAEIHIRERGLSGRIETRLSDGVAALSPGEAESLICAGMGGKLMNRIMERGFAVVSCMKELILEPQSETGSVRRFLREHGFRIAQEDMVYEDGKYYPVIQAVPGRTICRDSDPRAERIEPSMPPPPETSGDLRRERIEDNYGRRLLDSRHPVLRSFLERERRICREILAGLPADGTARRARHLEISQKLGDIEEALAYYEETEEMESHCKDSKKAGCTG